VKINKPAPLRTFAINKNALILSQILVIVFLLALVAIPLAQAQTFSVIHDFSLTGNGWDGAYPFAGVTLRAGTLFGTTAQGGNGPATGPGTIYQMTHVGPDWTYTPIFVFPKDGSGGGGPSNSLFGPDHHLYGIVGGGSGGDGIIFNLTPPLSICKTANCFWKQKILYSFMGGASDGSGPTGDLTWDQQGNIYGTTAKGGPEDVGSVYELTPSGSGWSEHILYFFRGYKGPGNPSGGVIFDSKGNLWGTAGSIVFELTYLPGVGWEENVIHSFQEGSDGTALVAGLIADSAGNFYGATTQGGSGGGGTVFELSPSGDSYTFQVLYSFSGGGGPRASLTMDAAGDLYGTTWRDGAYQKGTVFKLSNTPNGWVYSLLHEFTGGGDGAEPISQVTIDTDGTLYGTASQGGSSPYCLTNGCGVVWMITP